jgi:glutamate carboxypeptidase
LVFQLCFIAEVQAQNPQDLEDYFGKRESHMIRKLEDWVNVNTGSENLEGLEAFSHILIQELEDLEFEAQVHKDMQIAMPYGNEAIGPLIIAKRPSKVAKLKFLLVGHYDTVFDVDSDFQKFEIIDPDKGIARGPGVNDMKGGLVCMFEALRGLKEFGHLDKAEWTMILNPDEEIGSLGSRPWIEKYAKENDWGFVFEPSYSEAAMVKSRRGLGQVFVQVKGKAAHAGKAHQEGVSAIKELSEKIIRIERLTDYRAGVTVNVGTIHGGTKRNIIPEEAESWIDLRYDDLEKGNALLQKIKNIAHHSYVPGTGTSVWVILHRPPKLFTSQVQMMMDLYYKISESIGIHLAEPVHAGGGTDGSLMGNAGLPALDSMGTLGGRIHSREEYIDLNSLKDKAMTTILFWLEIFNGALKTQEVPIKNVMNVDGS